MADKSKIEWTDSTWNPIRGTKGKWHCTKVSPGCKFCYAERLNQRFGGPAYVAGADDLRLDERVLEQPLRWRKPRMVFVCSMTDLFHEDVPEDWLVEVFAVMAEAERHTFQVLTKRAARMESVLNDLSFWGCVEGACQRRYHERTGEDPSMWLAVHGPLPNVWLGVSVEDQERADERIPLLLQTPAAVRFVSVEPLLGPVDLRCFLPPMGGPGWMSPYCPVNYNGEPLLHWVIVGGESGPEARPMHPEWARSLRDQCQAAEVPFFFKQWGAWVPDPDYDSRYAAPRLPSNRMWVAALNEADANVVMMYRAGKKAAGRLLDGRTWDEMPEVLIGAGKQ